MFPELNVSDHVIYLKTRSNRIKIRETLNRCNSENNDSLSTDERSLEARILAL